MMLSNLLKTQQILELRLNPLVLLVDVLQQVMELLLLILKLMRFQINFVMKGSIPMEIFMPT